MNARYFLSAIGLLSCSLLSQAQPAYPPAPPAPENITAIEWFIDHDPGIGQGHSLPVAAAGDLNALAANITLTGVRPGVHRLFIRSQDHAGNWSLTASSTFENLQPAYTLPPAPPQAITAMEVFFDKDPGIGNGSIQVLSAGTDINDRVLTLQIDTLTPGAHQLFARSFSNTWSLSAIAAFNNDVTLPLTWSYVKAALVNDQSLISWGTLQESNTLRFDIEYSTDGMGYHVIGTVAAAGTSNTLRDYQWTHPAPAPGLNYYRIKQVDADGRFTWSEVVSVTFRPAGTRIVLSPNPTKGRLTLRFPQPAAASLIYVYSAAGQLVMSATVNKGEWQKELDLSRLTTGIYTIIIKDKETSVQTKISLLK